MGGMGMCCPMKKVSGHPTRMMDGEYVLVSEYWMPWMGPPLPWRCYSTCVYEKKGHPGKKYCFAPSEKIESECMAHDMEGSMEGNGEGSMEGGSTGGPMEGNT